MLAKEQVLEIVSSLPANISFDEILKTLSIIQSDQKAEADIKAGRIYTTKQAKERIRELAKQ
jgi:hypothetical protein